MAKISWVILSTMTTWAATPSLESGSPVAVQGTSAEKNLRPETPATRRPDTLPAYDVDGANAETLRIRRIAAPPPLLTNGD
uniref:Uncharacterized protein n=1 Tax=Mycena chlorophos TaxID=658473 RepID=A0ABQ0L269_MYCCL|nr:predicted protein [Mycena chlorophos]